MTEAVTEEITEKKKKKKGRGGESTSAPAGDATPPAEGAARSPEQNETSAPVNARASSDLADFPAEAQENALGFLENFATSPDRSVEARVSGMLSIIAAFVDEPDLALRVNEITPEARIAFLSMAGALTAERGRSREARLSGIIGEARRLLPA